MAPRSIFTSDDPELQTTNPERYPETTIAGLRSELATSKARVAELEKALAGRDRAMQKIIERNMELQELLPDQSVEGGFDG